MNYTARNILHTGNLHKGAASIGIAIVGLLIAVLVGSGIAAADADPGPYAYAANSGSRSVSVIDISDNSIVATIPVSGKPYEVVKSPDAGRVYVSHAGPSGVAVIDTGSRKEIGTIDVGLEPLGMAVSSDGSRLYVANQKSDSISVVDTSSNSVIATVGVGIMPVGIALSLDGSKVYVTNKTSRTVSVIDAASNTLIKTIAVGAAPWGIEIHPDGRAFVGNLWEGNVSIIDTISDEVVGEISLADLFDSAKLANATNFGLPVFFPRNIAFTSDGAYVYITNRLMNIVSVADASTYAVIATIPVFGGPFNVELTPDGSSVLVTAQQGGVVTVISTASNTITGTIPVEKMPWGLAIVQPLPPEAPTAVTASAGDASATVNWSAPANDGRPAISGYTVTSTPDNVEVTTASNVTAAVVSGLVNGTTYTFTVTATNSAGTGAASAPSNAVTPATVPDAPTGVSATAGEASAVITWTAPASDGGSAIAHYAVVSSPGGLGVSTAGNVTTAAISGLANGTTYTFTITATNAIGSGTASAPSNAVTTPITVPGVAIGVTATWDDPSATATVTWMAPASDGGSAITGYSVTSSAGDIVATTAGDVTTADITGLDADTIYTFTVTATNAAGTGPASTSSNPVPITVPGAPTGVSAVGGNPSAIVTWTAPTLDGGAVITGYTITTSPGGEVVTTTADVTTVKITGLVHGTEYTFTVAAINEAGTGPVSVPSNVVIPITMPDAPTGVSATAGAASTTVTWIPPAIDGSSVITGYTVTSSPGDLVVTTAGDVTTAVISGLSTGVAYTFTVTATNAAGTGPASEPTNAITLVGLVLDQSKTSVSVSTKDDGERLKVKTKFKIGDGSDGIDLLDEDVTIQVGEYDLLIEAGSFTFKEKKNHDDYEYKGMIGDDKVKVKFKEKNDGSFDFTIEITRPVGVHDLDLVTDLKIWIGNDYGEAEILDAS